MLRSKLSWPEIASGVLQTSAPCTSLYKALGYSPGDRAIGLFDLLHVPTVLGAIGSQALASNLWLAERSQERQAFKPFFTTFFALPLLRLLNVDKVCVLWPRAYEELIEEPLETVFIDGPLKWEDEHQHEIRGRTEVAVRQVLGHSPPEPRLRFYVQLHRRILSGEGFSLSEFHHLWSDFRVPTGFNTLSILPGEGKAPHNKGSPQLGVGS